MWKSKKLFILSLCFFGFFSEVAVAKPMVSWIQESWACQEAYKSKTELNMELDLWYPEGQVTVLNWNLEICEQDKGSGCLVSQYLNPVKLVEPGKGVSVWPLSRMALFHGELSDREDYYFRVLKGPSQKDRSLKGYVFLRELDTTTNLRPIKKLIFVRCERT